MARRKRQFDDGTEVVGDFLPGDRIFYVQDDDAGKKSVVEANIKSMSMTYGRGEVDFTLSNRQIVNRYKLFNTREEANEIRKR